MPAAGQCCNGVLQFSRASTLHPDQPYVLLATPHAGGVLALISQLSLCRAPGVISCLVVSSIAALRGWLLDIRGTLGSAPVTLIIPGFRNMACTSSAL